MRGDRDGDGDQRETDGDQADTGGDQAETGGDQAETYGDQARPRALSGEARSASILVVRLYTQFL